MHTLMVFVPPYGLFEFRGFGCSYLQTTVLCNVADRANDSVLKLDHRILILDRWNVDKVLAEAALL